MSGWLTDECIAFFESYLEQERLPAYPGANVSLLPPTVSYMLMMQEKESLASMRSSLPDFSGTSHIFLPVNDMHDPGAAGGTHWSLLLVSYKDGVAFHYDSWIASRDGRGSNHASAKQLCGRLAKVLDRPLRLVDVVDAPQQRNGSDCGVYVCLLIETLLFDRLLKSGSGNQVSMTVLDKEIDAARGRKYIARLVNDRRDEGERRRR